MSKRLAFMLAVALGGCAGSGTAHVGYAASVTVRSPELVTVDGYDNVYVLADADEPVFYADDYYWLYRSDRWYRSRSYDRDWVYVSEPAPRVRRISQPTAFVRYRTRHQEARNVPRPAPPLRDPWRDQYDRSDAPTNLPPREQQPLQPTQPQQAPTPYPRPPQQEPVSPPGHDRDRDRARDVKQPGPPANHDARRDEGRPDNRGQANKPDKDKDKGKGKPDKSDKPDKKDKKHDH